MYIVQYLNDESLSEYLCWSYPVDYFQNQVCLSICPSVSMSVCTCSGLLLCYPVDYCIKFQVSSIYIYLTVPFSLNICICLSIYLCLPVLDYCWGYPVDYFQIQVCLQGWRYHLSPFCTAENKKILINRCLPCSTMLIENS